MTPATRLGRSRSRARGLAAGGAELVAAEAAAHKLIKREPLRESAHALLMEVLAARGDVAQALQVYDDLRVLLRDELGTVPSAPVRALSERLLQAGDAGGKQDAWAPVELPAVLRRESRVLGRKAELDALRAIWLRRASEAELVLLAGEPGIGKTTVAALFAREIHANGGNVLYGRCDDDPPGPYQPFVEALRPARSHVARLLESSEFRPAWARAGLRSRARSERSRRPSAESPVNSASGDAGCAPVTAPRSTRHATPVARDAGPRTRTPAGPGDSATLARSADRRAPPPAALTAVSPFPPALARLLARLFPPGGLTMATVSRLTNHDDAAPSPMPSNHVRKEVSREDHRYEGREPEAHDVPAAHLRERLVAPESSRGPSPHPGRRTTAGASTRSQETRPKLKPFARLRGTGELCLVRENGVEVTLGDPEGRVSDFLDLLDGTRDTAELTAALASRWPDTRAADVTLALDELDAAGLVEDAAAPCRLSHRQQERYFSNLAFFETFARLDRSRFELQEALGRANVLLLGVGGLGSSLLLHLAGLGVGHITALDRDRVELRNLSRQFLYSEADVGAPKLSRAVARARSFNSEPAITAVQRHVRRPDDVTELLDGVDLVLSAIDRPLEVQSWVNEACVTAGVPFVAGGMQVTRGLYFSVAPGHSACLSCLQTAQERAHAALLGELRKRERTNRGIAPVASLLAGLVGLEAVRYLTGFAPPVAAARLWVADFVTGQVDVGLQWPRLDDCPVCPTSVAEARR